MAKKTVQLTASEIEHIELLRKHPELGERFRALLEISEGKEGRVGRADEIEELISEELRKMGSASITEWAKDAEKRVGQAFEEENPGSYCGKKKS